MMIHSFPGGTADDAWRQMVAAFKTQQGSTQGSRMGETDELLHVAVSVEDPRSRWVTSRCPALSPALALAELIWIMAGRRDLRFLQFWAPIFRTYSDDGEVLHGAYGYRLRVNLGIDQLNRAYDVLRNRPDTRQVVLQIWDGRQDLPAADGEPSSRDIPCNVSSLLKVRGGKLEWLQVIRSNDVFLGVPHNFVQFTAMQEIIAGWLGIEVGTYNQISDSLHVYAKDREKLYRTEGEPPRPNTDDLRICKQDSDFLFAELGRRTEFLVDSALEIPTLRRLFHWVEAPQAYRNILLILAAESARKRGWIDESADAAARVSNPVFEQLWRRWLNRRRTQG